MPECLTLSQLSARHSPMSNESEPERWQRRYYDAVDHLRAAELEWQEREDGLRRLASRLCLAARGAHPELDQALTEVVEGLRRPLAAQAAEALQAMLTAAIAKLDSPDAEHAGAGQAAANDLAERLPKIGSALLQLLHAAESLDTPGQGQRNDDPLAQTLRTAPTPASALQAIARAGALTHQHLDHCQQDKVQMQQMLETVSRQLTDISSYLDTEQSNRANAVADQRGFDERVRHETDSLASSTRSATDLASLQQAVVKRLGAIDDHLREHARRFQDREAEFERQSEQMRGRVTELENQTQVLGRALQKRQHQSLTDALTQVPNRLAWQEKLQVTLQQWDKDKRTRCIATIDIDHFKVINDRYGHAAGDQVLKTLAQHLSRRLRDVDFLARWGGEEFVVLLDGVVLNEAFKVMDKLRQTVEQHAFRHHQHAVPVTISCGITNLRTKDTAESLFERADRALYQAKHNGRNQCIAW